MHTIGEMSTMFGLPVSTLRYYDQMGLLPEMPRVGGFRRFGPVRLEALRVIECLKGSGLQIKDIKRFMDRCAQGPSTYPERRALEEGNEDFARGIPADLPDEVRENYERAH